MPVPVPQVGFEEEDSREEEETLYQTPTEDEGAGYLVPVPVTPQGVLEGAEPVMASVEATDE